MDALALLAPSILLGDQLLPVEDLTWLPDTSPASSRVAVATLLLTGFYPGRLRNGVSGVIAGPLGAFTLPLTALSVLLVELGLRQPVEFERRSRISASLYSLLSGLW